MAIDLHDPNLVGAVERSNCPSLVKLYQKEFQQCLPALAAVLESASDLREVSFAALHQTPDGHALGADSALLALLPSQLGIFQLKGLIKKRVEPTWIRFDSFEEAVADEFLGPDRNNCEFSIQFFAAGRTPMFRLAWVFFTGGGRDHTSARIAAATERDRFLAALLRLRE